MVEQTSYISWVRAEKTIEIWILKLYTFHEFSIGMCVLYTFKNTAHASKCSRMTENKYSMLSCPIYFKQNYIGILFCLAWEEYCMPLYRGELKSLEIIAAVQGANDCSSLSGQGPGYNSKTSLTISCLSQLLSRFHVKCVEILVGKSLFISYKN